MASCKMFENHGLTRHFSNQEFCNTMKKHDNSSTVVLNNNKAPESSNIGQEEDKTKLTQNCTILNLSTEIDNRSDENPDRQCDAMSTAPSGDSQLCLKKSASRSNSPSRESLTALEGDIRLSVEKDCGRGKVNVDIFRLHSKCTYTLLDVGRSIMLTVIKHHLNDANLHLFNAALVSHRKDTPALPRIDKLDEHFKNKDVLFLYHVITNTTFIPSPRNGWGKNVDPLSITSSDDLERIRQMRNKIVHDPTTFSERVLRGHWNDLMYLVKRIDQEYNTDFHESTRSLEDCCGMRQRNNSMQFANLGSTEMKYMDPYLELDKLVKEKNISKEVSDAFKDIIRRLPRRDKVLYAQSFKSQSKNEKETNLIKKGRRTKSVKFEYTWDEEDKEDEEDGNQDVAIKLKGQMDDNQGKEILQALGKIINSSEGAENRSISLEVSTNCHITDSKEGSLILLIKCKDANSKADLKRKLESGSIGIVLKHLLQFACLEIQIDNVDDIEVTLQKQTNRKDSFAVKDCPHLEFIAKHENLILEELCPSTMIECLEQNEIDMTAVRQAIDEYPDDRLYHISCLLSTLVKTGEEACAVFKSCLDDTGHAYLNAEWNKLQTGTGKEKSEACTDPDSTEDVINQDVQDNISSLHRAARNGHTDVVRQLLERGADVNASDENNTSPLHEAAGYGRTDVVRLLLQSGADVNKADKDNMSSLHRAARSGHTNVVRLLLEWRADVNTTGEIKKSPLHEAAGIGHTDVVRLLLQSGADVNRTDIFRRKPLHEAARSGHTDVVELLLKFGANASSTDNFGISPLHEAEGSGHTDVVMLMLKDGAHVSKRGENVPSPVQKAAGYGHKDAQLVESGTDVNGIHKSVPGPVQKAAGYGHKDVKLVESGTDVNGIHKRGLEEKLGRHDSMLKRSTFMQIMDDFAYSGDSNNPDDLDFMPEFTMSRYKEAEPDASECTTSKCKDADTRKPYSTGLVRKSDEEEKEAHVRFERKSSRTSSYIYM